MYMISISHACSFNFRNGNSKGIAYVDFVDAKSASTAVMKLDGYELMGRPLHVAISAPPTASDGPQATSSFASRQQFSNTSNANTTRKFLPRTEQKSRISFIPASVQKSAATSSGEQPAGQNMSNDDFRKMLMK